MRDSVIGIFDTARRALSKGADEDSATSLVKTFNAEAERVFLRVKADEQIALGCDNGCSYCCSMRVAIYEHEAIAIHQHVIKQFSKQDIPQCIEVLQANARQINQLTERERLGTNIPCAFLRNRRCSIYSVRPSACAGYHSVDTSACLHSYENQMDFETGIPKSRTLAGWYQMGDEALGAAQEQAGRSPMRTELNTTVLSVFMNSSNPGRWKKGKRLVAR